MALNTQRSYEPIQNDKITVKFRMTNTHVIAHPYQLQQTISEIKNDLASKFKIYPINLNIHQNDQLLSDDIKIRDLSINEFGIIDLELSLTPESIENSIVLDVDVYYSHYTLPEIITVEVPSDEGGDAPKKLLVEIENKSIVKPFLGGYRNTKTYIDYHDALTQTGPALSRMKFLYIWSRDTQTVEKRDQIDDTTYSRATQAFGKATELIYIPGVADYEIEAKKYETYMEKLCRENKLKKVRLIQRNFRAYMIRKVIREAAKEYRLLVKEQERRKNMLEEIYVNRYKKECVIKTYPRTKEDFDMLYSQVQQWKEREVKKISELHSGGPKIAALNGLLDNEITLLNAIEKQRVLLKSEAKDYKTVKYLKKLGKPKEWIGYNDILIKMDTLRTQHVRFLTTYYNQLKTVTEKEQRFELITEIEKVLENEETYSLITKIKDLFEKEKDLMCCNVSADDLQPLRLRELVIFLDIIKDEEHFKPEKHPSKLCEKCKKVRPIAEFALHTRQSEVNICKICSQLKVAPIDKSVYRAILRAIRRDERKRSALASYAFVIQEEDLRYIVENIWHGHSIISQNDIRTELRLPRWQIGDDWSPWNCVCLTETEARAHVKIKNIEEVYESKLISDIQNKTMLAKSVFKKLRAVDYDFVQSGDWWTVGLDGKTV